jgi:geranylgeranyl diphosphate synthase type I
MTLDHLTQTFLPAIEDELRQVVALADGAGLEQLSSMLAYHLGWEGEAAGPEARGKRIRPLLVLLTNAAAGGEWQHALPAAAAVELVHNFSLIHDDIEDNSPLRRGRSTVWVKWGIPQAINTGDAMFTLAHLAILRQEGITSSQVTIKSACLLQETCLRLTQGQFLDIFFESRGDLALEAYWPMVSGKTAALLAACTELGALTAESPEPICRSYRQFGHFLGLAFQALDDLLGIWGDAALTGKSADSDLLSGKKSLPVLFGLAQNGAFALRWRRGSITPDETPALAAQLEVEGGRAYTQEQANHLTDQAMQALQAAHPVGEAGQALNELASQLLRRKA